MSSSSCTLFGECEAADTELNRGVFANETDDLREWPPESAKETREWRFFARSDADGEIESADSVERRVS